MSQEKERAASHDKQQKKTMDESHEQQMLDIQLLLSQKSSSTSRSSIVMGICAMKKKTQSKPMKEILRRLKCEEIEILEMWPFLEKHWSQWPKVDALVCFHSDGFPYLMAWNYVKKYRPFLINNLEKQQLLWDRTAVYDILRRIKVPVAKHFMVFRDMNYIDEIEERGFGKIYTEDGEQTTIASMKTNYDDRKSGVASSNVDSVPLSPNHQSRMNRRHLSFGLAENEWTSESPQHCTTHEIKQKIEDQVITQSAQSEIIREDDQKKKRDSRSCLRSKPSSNKFEKNQYFPNTLRQFHEKREKDMKIFEVEEVEDHLIFKCGSQSYKMYKPFVEKPFDSENHQICVYYPESMGGGRKMLFRKINNASSKYQTEESQIRRDGNYIYEEFLPTNAFDIKVYTIGPYYMYAEARRSPTLDGVVKRNSEGKEVRFPVILTPDEKFICNRIVQEFGQEVCGFDLLRAEGKSYVCDVNGWSFVKANPKYWDDCSIILKKKIFQKFFPQKKLNSLHSHYDRFSSDAQNHYRPPIDRLEVQHEELRSIVSIFRHGDRSPKLKLKIKTKDPRFIEFFANLNKDEIKLKDEKNLTKVLNITNSIIAEMEDITCTRFKEFGQMKTVLESGGHFQGFTRKLQLKVQEREEEAINGKRKIKAVLIVLKWGGELSWNGYQDAIELGKKMRIQRYGANDFVSLYSSYKHDVKTYSSDEGRCIKTAAAFLKGFLNINGELAPIITSMVNINRKAQRLLDCTSQQNHSKLSDRLQQKLAEMLNSEELLMVNYHKNNDFQEISHSMKTIINDIGHPLQKLAELHLTIKTLVNEIDSIEMDRPINIVLHDNNNLNEVLNDTDKCEDSLLIYKRWSKLQKDFLNQESGHYNISKIPEIYDTIRHDLRKNQMIFNMISNETKEKLQNISKLLAHFVMPNEYGITDKERVQTAKNIALPLLEKILIDLMFWKEKHAEEEQYWKYKNIDDDNWRHIRTRLYFTSASHMYSILNIILLGNGSQLMRLSSNEEAEKVKQLLFMGYLSHIEFRLYQNLKSEEDDPKRFRLELSLCPQYDKVRETKEYKLGGSGFTIYKIKQFIENFTAETKRMHSESKDDRKKHD